jgi:hypothetical protein
MPANRKADRPIDALHFPAPIGELAPHPPVPIDMVIAASAEMLPIWNADPDFERRRLARKSRERFALR